MSADGRYVLFNTTSSSLNPADRLGYDDVFLRDRRKHTTVQVSLTRAGSPPVGDSVGLGISSDGSTVLFTSTAGNLVRGDGPNRAGSRDLFTYTTRTRIIRKLRTPAASTYWALSGNGRWLAYSSPNSKLVPGDTNGVSDVFVENLRTGATERVSVSSSGAQGNAESGNAEQVIGGLGLSELDLSSDGRYVVFESDASNLAPGDTNVDDGYANDVFVRDRLRHTTIRVDASSPVGGALSPRISPDGRLVTFGANCPLGGPPSYACMVLRDTHTGATTYLGSGSMQAVVSADDHSIAWKQDSGQIAVRDLRTGKTQLASVSTAGQPGAQDSGCCSPPALSANGRFVAFASAATNLVKGDDNARDDVFVRDRTRATTERLNVSSHGQQTFAASRLGPATRTLRTPFYGNKATLFGQVWAYYGDPSIVAVNTTGVYVESIFMAGAQKWSGPFYGRHGTFLAEIGDGDPGCDPDGAGCGAEDLIAVTDTGVYTELSMTGTHFGPPIQGTKGPFYGQRATLVADVNGDGRADIIAVNRHAVDVKLGRGDGTFGNTMRWSNGPFFGRRGTLLADANGDGRADIIAVNPTGSTIRLSTGRRFGPTWLRIPFLNRDANHIAFADIDGNGTPDAILYGTRHVLVARGRSHRFGAAHPWTQGPYCGAVLTAILPYSNAVAAVNKDGVSIRIPV